MDTGRFPVDSQVDVATWKEVRVCSFCLLGLVQLCQSTTMPNYKAKEIFRHKMLVSLPWLWMEKLVYK